MKLLKVLEYLKARLAEKSTYAAIGIAVTGAAALAPPWSYVFVGIGVVGALIPSSSDNHDDCDEHHLQGGSGRDETDGHSG